MSTESITKKISDRICKHMNKDHSNALIAYASHYGGVKDPKKVVMEAITSTTMQLKVNEEVIHIPFDHQLMDSEDAHRTLVSMLKEISKPSG